MQRGVIGWPRVDQPVAESLISLPRPRSQSSLWEHTRARSYLNKLISMPRLHCLKCHVRLQTARISPICENFFRRVRGVDLVGKWAHVALIWTNALCAEWVVLNAFDWSQMPIALNFRNFFLILKSLAYRTSLERIFWYLKKTRFQTLNYDSVSDTESSKKPDFTL